MPVRVDAGVAVKRARPDDPASAQRLRREAEALQRLTHPGLVQLIGWADDPAGGAELRTVAVTGPPLMSLVGSETASITRTVAALATTVADLHELGVAHTRLTADHVLLDEAARPVICGLGETVATNPNEREAADDVAALGRLLAECLEVDPVDPLASLRNRRLARRDGDAGLQASLERLMRQATAEDWRDRPTARTLADALWTVVDHAGAGHRPQRRPGPRWSPGARWAAGAAVGVAALIGWYAVAVAAARPARRAAPTRSIRSATPERPQGGAAPNGTVLTIDGHRYAVGAPGDQVVVGQFDCAHTTAAVLTPQGGLFVFDQLATDGVDVTARHLRDVDPSATVKISDDDGDGCDELVVQPVAGPATTVSTREPS